MRKGKKNEVRELFCMQFERGEMEMLRALTDYALQINMYKEFETMFRLKCLNMAIKLKMDNKGEMDNEG